MQAHLKASRAIARTNPNSYRNNKNRPFRLPENVICVFWQTQCWNSDSSTTIKNFIIGNTCYRNENYIPFYVVGNITDGNGTIVDDGEFTAYSSDNNSFINNISFPDVNISPMNVYNVSNIFVDHNLWAANFGIANPLGINTITTSLNFILPTVNPLLADFHLES